MTRTHRLLPLGFDARNALPELGAAIRDARLARKLRQRDLAMRAAVGVSTIKRIEAGDPRVAVGRVLEVLACLSPGFVEALIEAAKADPSGDVLRRTRMGERVRPAAF